MVGSAISRPRKQIRFLRSTSVKPRYLCKTQSSTYHHIRSLKAPVLFKLVETAVRTYADTSKRELELMFRSKQGGAFWMEIITGWWGGSSELGRCRAKKRLSSGPDIDQRGAYSTDKEPAW